MHFHPRFRKEDIASMKHSLWNRSLSALLALILLLGAVPFTALAAEKTFTLIQLEGTDVTLDETVFTYTGQEIRPNVTVRVKDQLLTLDKDYTLRFENNIEVGTGKAIVTGIATASETVGYTGTVEIPFTINPAAPAIVELKGTDVTIEGTKFTYTGSYIEPKVTVTVDGKELKRDEHYKLTYHSNIAVGTATASVTGIESAGYTGQVNINFTIEKEAGTPEFQLIQLQGTDVTLEGTKFTHTGKAIEPKVTVTVKGKVLTLGQDYSLVYENNINVGTAYAVVRGIATASETVGYTGEVKIPFTIEKAEETKPTEPEATEPEATEPETKDYQITKGDKSTWYQGSAKTLSFTVNGWLRDFQGVQIDGKNLDSKYFTTKGDTTVTLTNAFLKKLATGKHTITLLFEDGKVEGAFKVAEGLDPTNPETGDGFNMGAWLSVMGLSLTGASALFVFRKKIF